VLPGVPFVHGIKAGVLLMNGNHRTFGKNIEVFVRHQGGYFNNHIGFRLQPGHFQVYPDEIEGIFLIVANAHGFSLARSRSRSTSDTLICDSRRLIRDALSSDSSLLFCNALSSSSRLSRFSSSISIFLPDWLYRNAGFQGKWPPHWPEPEPRPLMG